MKLADHILEIVSPKQKVRGTAAGSISHIVDNDILKEKVNNIAVYGLCPFFT
jgi:hypothetical protein